MTHRRRPHFASREQWTLFNQLHPIYRCVVCDDTDESKATVDHIVAVQNGCPQDVQYWQWMCGPCNSRKGKKADTYWGQPLHFDQDINLVKCRTAQRAKIWDQVLTYSDYFCRPWSQLAGIMHIFAGVVGCGKTLAPPILAHALNHVIRRDCGEAYPRVDRILVLTKEQSIRNQLSEDLGKDMSAYGISGIDPRVDTIGPSTAMLAQLDGLKTKDIWVSCLAMFFEKNGRVRNNLAEILAMFPLIWFDETHFASDQVLKILKHAHTSLCFGGTGSPIEAGGDLITRFFLFSLYDYDSACNNDQSMKMLVGPDDPRWPDIVEEIKIDSADLSTGDGADTTENSVDNRYRLNIRPAISVMERVILIVHDRDARAMDHLPIHGPLSPAIHRPQDSVPDLIYPSHAMIAVGSVKEAEMLCAAGNRIFESDRRKYPLDRGYQFAYVCSASEDEDGNEIKGNQLLPKHAWFWSQNHEGKLSRDSIRFLVVVDMGREGINGLYCNVVGVASSNKSIIEGVQRFFGRQARAVMRKVGEVLHVPPAELDTMKVVTHETYGNMEMIKEAARFLLDMEGKLAGMPTIDVLIDEEDVPEVKDIDPRAGLTPAEKLSIIDKVGRIRIDDGDIPEDSIDAIAIAYGGGSSAKKDRAFDWINTVVKDPDKAAKSLALVEELHEVPRVIWEHLNITPTDDEIRKFMITHKMDLVGLLPRIADDPGIHLCCVSMYRDHYGRFRMPEIPTTQTTSGRARKIATDILTKYLRGIYEGDKDTVYKFTGKAVQLTLGVKNGEQFKDKGKYDTPECHAILNREEIERNIRGYVIRRLMDQGHCPTLAAGIRLSDTVMVTP